MSISPSGYYYHTGVNSNLIDSLEYKEISKKAHFGLRLEIETEVAQLIDLDIFEGDYFFHKKNNIANMSMEELNKYLILFGCKTLKKISSIDYKDYLENGMRNLFMSAIR